MDLADSGARTVETAWSPSRSISGASRLPTRSWPRRAALGVAPGHAAVFEDALAGVAAGRAGQFGYVVGVDRVGQADALLAHGADRVVRDLADAGPRWSPVISHPAFQRQPWSVSEDAPAHGVAGADESVFALSNGHIGVRGNLDEGEPHGLPGTYLNGVYELRPLPYAEAPTAAGPQSDRRQRDQRQAHPVDRRRRALRRPLRRAARARAPLDFRAGTLHRRGVGVTGRAHGPRLLDPAGVVHPAIDRAICYEVEPVDRRRRVVVQSELVGERGAARPASADPRGAAVLEQPADLRVPGR